MRVYLKCDKHYNSTDLNVIDSSSVDYLLLEDLVFKYVTVNKSNKPIIDITEEVVDYYNEQVGNGSCKSAQSIVNRLRYSWVQNFADKIFMNKYCKECNASLSLQREYNHERHGYDCWLVCGNCGESYDLDY